MENVQIELFRGHPVDVISRINQWLIGKRIQDIKFTFDAEQFVAMVIYKGDICQST